MTKAAKGRVNVNFRQTMRAFRGARQASVFAKINRNLPYNVLSFSRKIFEKQVQRLKSWKEKKHG